MGNSKAAAPLHFPHSHPFDSVQSRPLPLSHTQSLQMERCSEGFSTGTFVPGIRRPASTDDSFTLTPFKRQRLLDLGALATPSHGQVGSGIESPDSLACGRAQPPLSLLEGILRTDQRGSWSHAGAPPACTKRVTTGSRLDGISGVSPSIPISHNQQFHIQALGVSEVPAEVHQQLRAALVDSAAQRLKSAFLEEQLAVAQDSLGQARAGLQAAEDQATLLRHYLQQCLKKLRENDHAEGGGENDVSSKDNDDAESACKGNLREEKKAVEGLCSRCHSSKANVLLIPCRHLAVCKECEPHISACPSCGGRHAAALHIQEA